MNVAQQLRALGGAANSAALPPGTPSGFDPLASPDGRKFDTAVNADVLPRRDPERAASALWAIPANLERPDWRNVLWALKAAGGTFEVALEWSRTGGGMYTGDDAVLLAWKSGDPNRPGGIGTGTLFKMAQDRGWRGTVPGPVAQLPAGAASGPADLSTYVTPWTTSDKVPRSAEFLVGAAGTGLVPMGAVSVMAAPGGFLKTDSLSA